MVKKSAKTSRVSRRPIYIILALSLVLAIGIAIWQSTRPEPIQIMAIDPLTYGNTTIEGVIQPNMAPEERDKFILILRDTRVVKLNVKGIDHLVSLPVKVIGNLSPASSEYAPMNMTVQSIIVAQE